MSHVRLHHHHLTALSSACLATSHLSSKSALLSQSLAWISSWPLFSALHADPGILHPCLTLQLHSIGSIWEHTHKPTWSEPASAVAAPPRLPHSRPCQTLDQRGTPCTRHTVGWHPASRIFLNCKATIGCAKETQGIPAEMSPLTFGAGLQQNGQ